MSATRSFTAASFAVLLGMSSLAHGFWRMECRARSGLARIDPLVSPGEVSSHAHAIHGSSGFSETSGYSDLMAGDCTSCAVSEDMSAYWTPALYFQDAATGEFTLVEQVGGMLAYYLLYPNAGNTTVSAFPEGFQMIAGDTNRRNFTGPVPDPPKSDWTAAETTQDSLAEKAIGFNCLNYNEAPEPSLYRHFMPDKAYMDANCVDGVRFELMFPSCWNGVDIDSENHKSHVAYPNQVMTGTCPDDYPERLISLFYETIWNTYEFVGQDGQFVIANGDPTGYGYHGDFMMGWDGSFLQDAADTCTNPSGEIEDCPLFTIQDSSVYDFCNFTLPQALVSENVVGARSGLPGDVLIQSGPAPAVEASTAGSTDNNPTATGSAVPTLGYSSASTSYSNQPGGVFAQSGSPTSINAGAAAVMTSSATSTSVAPPPTSAAASSSAPAATFYSTQYVTSGNAVDEILWVVETVYVTDTAVTTTTAAPAPPAKRHAHPNHAAREIHEHAKRHAGHGLHF